VLEGKEFRTRDIRSQIYAVFERMAKEQNIDLRVDFEGLQDNDLLVSTGVDGRKIYGPFGTGFVKNMVLWGDKTRILQVVVNLTSNALKFTPPGGNIQVVIRCLGDADLSRKGSLASRHDSVPNSKQRVYSNTPEKSDNSELMTAIGQTYSAAQPSPPVNSRDLMFEFEVQDSGPGVPIHLHERIFEPFFQGDMQLSKKYSGTGLGLSICQQLATLMRGSVTLRCEEGKGSTFTMRIPLRFIASRAGSTTSISLASSRPSLDEEVPTSIIKDLSTRDCPSPIANHIVDSDGEPEMVELSAPSFASKNSTSNVKTSQNVNSEERKLRILIAEDNKTNQMVLLRMLRMEKITHVDVAQDGKQALEMVKRGIERQTEYDLILMDVQMPNMDGLEATRLIRKAGFKQPIIALSAYSDDTNIKDCHDSGMDDFVSKPIQLSYLRLVLKTFCPQDNPPNSIDTSSP
jgi:osomolarity two-component system sensor histidine kinase SLN1